MKEVVTRKNFLAAFFAVAVATGTAAGLSAVAIVLYGISLGLSNSQIGLVVGASGFGMLLPVIPAGLLSDHYGAKHTYIFGGLAGAATYLFFPHIDGLGPFLLGAFVLGFFGTFRFVSMNSLYLHYMHHADDGKAGWFKGSHSIGMLFLGPLLGGYLVKTVGFAATFHVAGAIFLAVSLFTLFAFIDGEKAEGELFSSLGRCYREFEQVLEDRNVMEASLVEVLGLLAFSFFNTFIVVIALKNFNFLPETAALLISLEGAVFVATVFLLNGLADSLGHKEFYGYGLGTIGISLIVLGGASIPALLWLGAILLGLGLGMLNIINVRRLSVSSAQKGKVAGVFALFNIIGSTIGPVLGGALGSIVGIQTVFWLLLPLLFLAAVQGRSSYPEEL